jgi:hypothetical protein
MKEWFEGRSAAPPPIKYNPPWLDRAIEILCWACFGALIAIALPGCTTTREAEVCYMKPIGVTEQGFTVAFQQCMSPEAFQKAQE